MVSSSANGLWTCITVFCLLQLFWLISCVFSIRDVVYLTTFIYWFDDLFELTPLVRIVLSITSGAMILPFSRSVCGAQILVFNYGRLFLWGLPFHNDNLVNFTWSRPECFGINRVDDWVDYGVWFESLTPVYFRPYFGILLGFVFSTVNRGALWETLFTAFASLILSPFWKT